MLTRSDLLAQLGTLSEQAARLRLLLTDESNNPPPVVAARMVCDLERLGARRVWLNDAMTPRHGTSAGRADQGCDPGAGDDRCGFFLTNYAPPEKGAG